MSILWEFLLLVLTILIFILFNLQQKRKYWKQQNVELIDLWKLMSTSKEKTFGCVAKDLYLEMREKRQAFAALELPLVSMLIVQDQEAIKDIKTTFYLNFADRGLYVNQRDLLSTNISRVRYDQWKPLRQNMTPCFSPGKIKFMFPTVHAVGERLVQVLEERCKKDPNAHLEVYDLCACYTTEVMGQAIFGIETNCLREPHTEFRIQGDRVFAQLKSPWKDFIGYKYPKLLQFFNVCTFDKESNDFFLNLVRQCLEYREQNNIKRQDFIDILINLRKGDKEHADKTLTLEALVSQIVALYVGGYETASCAMTYAIFEMAKNQEIQEKARKEIQEVLGNYNGQLTNESLKDLKYLNQIMLETLRKYPIAPSMPRVCTQSCTLNTPTGPINIKPGTYVIIPYYGIHYNPDYYPQPEQFRPERFDDEEIVKRPPCSFLAFGDGPKSCVGESFAKMQMLLGLAMMLSKFRYSLDEKSPKELKFDPQNMFLLFVKDGVHLKVEKV